MKALVVLGDPAELRQVVPAVSPLRRQDGEVVVVGRWDRAPERLRVPAQTLLERAAERGEISWDDGLVEADGRRAAAVRAAGRAASPARPGRVRRAVRVVAAALPSDRAISAQLRAHAPDVVAVCPFPGEDGVAAAYLRAARGAGLPSVGIVSPWDGLLGLGGVAVLPDHLCVWNEPVARAAARRHGIGLERFAVTGAVALEPLLKAKRQTGRESFCVQVGADHRRPLVLFAGAAERDEEIAAERSLLQALLAALGDRPATAAVQVLARPSPRAPGALDGLEHERLMAWPRAGLGQPDTRPLLKLLVQGITHSAVTVGDGLRWEAAVLDRPALTIASRAPRGAQRMVAGAASRVADAPAAAAAIEALLDGKDPGAPARRRFVSEFLLPLPARTGPGAALARALLAVAQGRTGEPWTPGGPGRAAALAPAAEPEPEAAPAPTGGGGGRRRAVPGGAIGDEELAQIARLRAEHLVDVSEPLVLISQVQRSGGTLLGQLFDSHPQCHAHPGELHIGHPQGKENWPRLDPEADPDTWYGMLHDRSNEEMFFRGYAKNARGKRLHYAGEERQRYPLVLPPSVQRALFDRCAGAREIGRARDVLDCYLTSYFNAWLDNRNLLGEKRWVTGFAPRLGVGEDNRRGFFADYPDGRLISCIREPKSWFVSARTYHAGRYGDVERSMRLWAWSAQSMIDAKAEYGEQVWIVPFERLVTDTDAAMRELAAFLGLEWDPILAVPTFNGHPMKANSSFPVAEAGMLAAPAARRRDLEPEAGDYIDREVDGLYERVTALAG